MPSLINSPTLGLERVARETLIVLIETLNDELAAQEIAWAPLDEDLATRRGLTYEPTLLEPVELQNFYLGYQPSLINAEVEKYPNVSVMADRAGSAPGGEAFDHIDVYLLSLSIELMVKSLKSEEEVNLRVQRMADAVNICMLGNKTLRGKVSAFEGAPDVNVSEVFVMKEKKAYGPEWVWQGARLEYVVRKEAQIPSGAFSRPASNSPSLLSGANIDQG